MTGVGLAASAGLRAWLPMLIANLLARSGLLHLNSTFSFLARPEATTILAVATVVEIFADKIIGLDHLLDVIGTFVRPVMGAVLAMAVLRDIDPRVGTILGIILGGGTALSVHGAKAVVRAKTSALAPFHGGIGNASVSGFEDVVSGFGAWFAAHAPLLAFVIAILALIGAIWIIVKSFALLRKLLT